MKTYVPRNTPITKLSTLEIFLHLYKRHEVDILYTAIAVTLVGSVIINLGVL